MSAALRFQLVAEAFCQAEGYEFKGAVAAGSFKETFRAASPTAGLVAVKILDPAAGNADRLVREVEAMRRCNHECIGPLISVGVISEAGTDYVVVCEPFLDGGSLLDRNSSFPLARTDVLDVGSRMMDAIEHLAQLNLVHRDIKPANIMYRSQYVEPILIDFGLVRDLAAASITHTFAPHGPGTPWYSAPEQLTNKKPMISWRTDQFSLGVLLSEIAGIGHPYQAPGETPDVALTRVAAFGTASTEFVRRARAANLDVLIQMVAPWPIQRFSNPASLARLWQTLRANG